MDRPRKIHKRSKEEYRMRTHLIHGNYESRHWDYDHHGKASQVAEPA